MYHVNEFSGSEWTVLVSPLPPGYDVTGMYLLWGSDRERLLEIGRSEIAAGNFHEARLSMIPGRRPAEHVLCILAPDGSQRAELARRVRDTGGGITYLYWRDGTTLPARRELSVDFGEEGGESR
ncbi:MAG TPA: hypothetical protein VF112_04540 [Candidatus Dormibacteraeota bacterium]